MIFSDTVDLQGMVQDVDFMASSNASKYPLNDKVRIFNQSYLSWIEYIARKSKVIKFADLQETAPYNYEEYNVTNGTENVTITEPFKFERAEIKDSNGTYTRLELISREKIQTAIQDYQRTTGSPKYITIDGDNLTFYPTPNYSVTNGLRIYDTPQGTLFTSADTTRTPDGVLQFAHKLISIDVALAYPFLEDKRYTKLIAQRAELKKQLKLALADKEQVKRVLRGRRTNAK